MTSSFSRIGTTLTVGQYTFYVPENDKVTVVPKNKPTVIDGSYKKIVTPDFAIYFGPETVFKGVLRDDLKLFDHNNKIFYNYKNMLFGTKLPTSNYVGMFKNFIVFRTDTELFKVINIKDHKKYKKMLINGPISKVYVHKSTAVVDQSTEYNPHNIRYTLNVCPGGSSDLISFPEKYILPWFNIRVINTRSSEKMLVTNIRKDTGLFIGSSNCWSFVDGTYVIALDNTSVLNYFEFAKKAE